MYTRDTLSHAHTPDPPCSSASFHFSHFSPSWRPGAVPACSSPCLGIGLNPASSGRDAFRPNPSPPPRTQRPQRRPAVPSQPQPSSPIRQKIRPSSLWPARTPIGGFGLARDCSPPSPPHPFLLPPRRATQPPAQTSPHRPATTSPTRATPRSARRRACPGASPTQPKIAAPRLKSFLEKTLDCARGPHFAPFGVCQTPPSLHHARSGHHYIRR